jgi:hypothetical protein
MVLVLGDQPDGAPKRFVQTEAGPEMIRVDLPADPYSIRAGSPQQVQFDRARAQAARRAAPRGRS